MLELYIVSIIMIAAAFFAVESKDLFSSVIGLATVGLGLSLCFLILKAPDLAIAQLVIEIMCIIILIRATIKEDLPFSISGRWFFNTLATLVFIGVFLGFGYICIRQIPEFGNPIMKITERFLSVGLKETGAANLVTSVMLDYRAYDTLGEVAVLFSAVMGVLAVMKRVGKR